MIQGNSQSEISHVDFVPSSPDTWNLAELLFPISLGGKVFPRALLSRSINKRPDCAFEYDLEGRVIRDKENQIDLREQEIEKTDGN